MLKDVYRQASSGMRKAVEALEGNLAVLRTSRASPALLGRVMVHAYGGQLPLQQVASITTPDVRTLSLQVWDKSLVSEVMKAIQTSDLNINPTNTGEAILLALPPLTEERRRDLVKSAHRQSEEARVAVRLSRREALEKVKKLQKAGLISEDELRDSEKEIRRLHDEHIAKIEAVLKHKEKEITSG